ncbi:IclR family transcriptional regulator [Bacillus benzoevorans]|uniref:Glycerol operon regulatory protein n=1 Tax=Bacillus benzoevorans TaxID=1456 RepID=A0A7X0HVP1_9BACI|nr:IclR family transcriptional regulator [Bacillus benzoevorans]MBB6447713.1 DNA-binding IclR family transcriptional regulator [Bacillus benzoevorans]
MAERLIQSVDRAADILELFLDGESELSVKDISEKLGLSKSTVHGLIKTLEHRGYLQQNPDDLKYKLGLKLFELGSFIADKLDIVQIARPFIKELVDELRETVHLVVRQQDELVYVAKEEGPQTLRISSHVGKKAPIHCTGVGKAILAYQNEREVDRILSTIKMQAFTEHTITDKEEIKKQLQTIKENGYSLEDEEIEFGLACVGAPIFDYNGNVSASLSCATPKMRLTDERLPEVIAGVKNAAAKISRCLGYKDVPHY